MEHRKVQADRIIAGAAQVLTCSSGEDNGVGLIRDGWIAIRDGRIAGIGQRREIEETFEYAPDQVINATGKVVLPGFVDCHTHVVFGGSRVEEYAAKMTVGNPAELKRRGIKTGIMVSVNQTRDAGFDELYHLSRQRLGWMMRTGTTTVESKSGYGLELETEIKQLEVMRRLNQDLSMDILPTFLGAHGWPDDRSKERYMDELVGEMIPEVKARGLAEFCDIWCDDGHYTRSDSERILRAGLDAGLGAKIHADAYSYIGATDLAAELKAVSADHLNYSPIEALWKMKEAGVPGVLLPGTDFAVRHPRPALPRAMVNMGLELGLGTNCCPGCWNVSMPFTMTLACRQHGLTPDEAILAATIGSAKAVNRAHDRGSLEVGKLADIQIWNTDNYLDIVYRYGENLIESVLKNGELVVRSQCP